MFKRKEDDSYYNAIDRAMVNRKVIDFGLFRKVGETFNFLGIEMIVLSHYILDYTNEVVRKVPKLSVAYRNGQGEIVRMSFDFMELGALQAQNPVIPPLNTA